MICSTTSDCRPYISFSLVRIPTRPQTLKYWPTSFSLATELIGQDTSGSKPCDPMKELIGRYEGDPSPPIRLTWGEGDSSPCSKVASSISRTHTYSLQAGNMSCTGGAAAAAPYIDFMLYRMVPLVERRSQQ